MAFEDFFSDGYDTGGSKKRGSSGPDPSLYQWAGVWGPALYGTGFQMERPSPWRPKKRRDEEDEKQEDPGFRQSIYELFTMGEDVPGFGYDIVAKSLSGAGEAVNWVGEKLPGLRPFTNEASDFFNFASMAGPRGVANAVGGALEFGARLVTDKQYYGTPIQPESYNAQGRRVPLTQRGVGAGAMLGDAVDDIALAFATAGASTYLSAARGVSTARSVLPGMSVLGRFAPVASSAERIGALAGSATSSIYGGIPRVGSGDISPTQLAAETVVQAPFDMMTAGLIGNSRLTNILGDALVAGTGGAVAGAVPLAMEEGYTSQDYLANLGLSAGIGTLLGAATNIGRRSRMQDAEIEGIRQAARSGGAVGAPAGASFTPSGLTPEEQIVRQQLEASAPQAAAPAKPEYVSDALLRKEIPEDEANKAAAVAEQERYLDNLLATLPKENLARLLDLQVTDPTIATEQEIRDKIRNEWIYQASNGKGIQGIDEVLSAAGLLSQPEVGPAVATPAEPEVVAGLPVAPEQPIAEAAPSGQLDLFAARPVEEQPVAPPSEAPTQLGLFGSEAESGFAYKDGKATKVAETIPGGPEAQTRVSVDAQDVKTGVPPTVTEALSGARDANGNPVDPELVFYGPENRPDNVETAGRMTEDVLLYKDPQDGNLYAIDGRSNLLNATNPVAPQNIVRDPETGSIKLSDEDQPGVAKVYDKNTGKLEAVVIEGDAEEAIRARSERNPELRRAGAEEVSAEATPEKKPLPSTEAKLLADQSERDYNSAVKRAKRLAEKKELADVEDSQPLASQPKVKKSYEAMKDDLLALGSDLINKRGVKIVKQPMDVDRRPFGDNYQSGSEVDKEIVENGQVTIYAGQEPASHPLSDESPIKAIDGSPLTYFDLLNATKATYGKANVTGPLSTPEGVVQTWAQYSPNFSAKSWPALAHEVRDFPAASIDKPYIERVAGVAKADASAPPRADVTVADLVGINSVTQPDIIGEVLDVSSPEGRIAKSLIDNMNSARAEADLPFSGVKAEAKKTLVEKQNAFMSGEPTEDINVSAKNRSPLFNTIAKSIGMQPGELAAAVEAGVTEFGPVRVLDVAQKKQRSGRVDTTAKFELDAESVRRVAKVERVEDLGVTGKLDQDNAENASLVRFEEEVQEAARKVALDVDKATLVEELSGSRSVTMKQRVELRDKINWEINRKLRQSFDAVSNSLVADTGIRPAAARMYLIKATSASLEADEFSRVVDAVDTLMTPQEQQLAQKWVSDAFRKGDEREIRLANAGSSEQPTTIGKAVKDLYESSGKAGDAGLTSIRLAAQTVSDLDQALNNISSITEIPKPVLLSMLDDTVSYAQGVTEADIASARNLLSKNKRMSEAFSVAKDDFAVLANYSLAKEIKEKNLQGDGGKPIKPRNVNGAISSIIGTAAWYVIDNQIQEFEDDELYMGIPGSVWKRAGGGGGYAAAMLGFTFAGRNATAPSSTSGWGRMLRSAADRVEKLSTSSGYVNLSKLSAADRQARHEAEVTEQMRARNIDPRQDTKRFQAEVQRRENMYRYLGGDTKIGAAVKYLGGLTTMARTVPAFKDIISSARTKIQIKTKDLYQMGELVAKRTLDLNKMYKDGRHVDAANEFDWRMSKVSNMEAQFITGTQTGSNERIETDVVDWEQLRAGIRNDIRDKYFSIPDPKDPTKKIIDRKGYAAYLQWQRSMNNLRRAHLKALVAKSVGAPDPTDLDGYYQSQKAEKELATASIGSLKDQLETSEKNYGVAMNTYIDAMDAEMARLGLGKKEFNAYLDEGGEVTAAFADARAAMGGAKADVKSKKAEIARQQQFLSDIRQRMSQIEDLPRMMRKSMRDGYLPRPRNGKAKHVLRVEAEDVGINVRFEIDDAAEVNRTKSDILREVAMRRAQKMYDPLYIKAGGQVAELPAAVTPESIAKMSDADLINLHLDTGKTYWSSYKQTTSGKAVKSSKEAKKIVAKAINLIENGGSAYSALRDGSKEIVAEDMLDDIITALDEMTEFSINQAELKKALTESGAYKRIVLDNAPSYEINIGEIGRLARRLITPPNPNLTRRRNVEGYYDTKWDATQKMIYLGQQIETMRYDITEGISRKIMTGAVDEFLTLARQYNINTNVTEWVSDYRDRIAGIGGPDWTTEAIANAERVARQYISGSSLTMNINAAIYNRILGMFSSAAAGLQEKARVYGAQKYAADGTLLNEVFFSSKLEADEFLQKKGVRGVKVGDESLDQSYDGWIPTTKYRLRNVGPGVLGSTVVAMLAPKTALKMKASSSPMWSALMQEINRLDLQDATFSGSISQSKLSESRTAALVKRLAYITTEKIERANNLTALMVFADVSMRQYGVSDADFMAMSLPQQEDMMRRIARLSEDGRKMALEEGVTSGTMPMAEDIRRAAMTKILGDAEAGRRMTQGGYASLDKTALEAGLDSVAGGIILQTFMAPILRGLDLSMSMTVGVVREQTASGRGFKQAIKAMVPVAAAYGVMAALVGAEATPFYGDAALATEVAHGLLEAASSEEERRKRSSKQYMEDFAGRMFENAGLKYEHGQKYMRAFYTEGLIRSMADVAIGYEGAIAGAVVPPGPGFISSVGKGMVRLAKDLGEKETLEALYRHKRLVIGTQPTKVVDALVQTARGEKLDNFGNPVIDPITGQPIGYSFNDGLVQALFGKKYSDIRTASAKYSDSVPLYSEHDKMNYMRTAVKNTKFIRFGASAQQELDLVTALWADAAKIERDIAGAMGSSKVRNDISQARKLVDEFLKSDQPFTELGYVPKDAVLQIQAQGLYDPSGRNTSNVKDALYGYIDDFYTSGATQVAVNRAYKRALERDPAAAAVLPSEVPYEVTDKAMRFIMSGNYPEEYGPAGSFAIMKFHTMYRRAMGYYDRDQ
jgi:hypothetical protein